VTAVSTTGRHPAAGRRGPSPVATSLAAAAAACLLTLAMLALGAFTRPRPQASGPRAHGRAAATRLPLDLLPVASAAIGAAERRYWAARDGASVRARGGGITSSFTPSGAALRASRGTLDLALTGVGRAGELARPSHATPNVSRNEVVYHRGALVELYRNGPAGIEQGFTLHARPGGAGPLVLALRSAGNVVPQQLGGQIVFRTRQGASVLRYGQLGATDASGRTLTARIALLGRTIELLIDDRGARYPLTIDPFAQQGAKLRPAGGEESAKGGLGTSVAVSGDGSTALIGARYGPTGAAWVFTRSGTNWSEQAKLVPVSDEKGEGAFGAAVALSKDGSRALIGGPTDNVNKGAAWVFTRSEAGKWTEEAKLTAGKEESGNGELGWSVALSETGETALVGGQREEEFAGAAWVFTRSGSTWSLQRKLTGTGESAKARFGYSVALSGDGTAALIGGPCDEAGTKLGELLPCEPTKGAAWSFIFESGEWKLQGAKFSPSGDTEAQFGSSVALSANGKTALVGGASDAGATGAAWTFTRPEPKEATWTQQAKLTGAPEEKEHAQFGRSVALSADGKTAMVGGPFDNAYNGAAWAFTTSGSKWNPEGRLTGAGAVEQSLFGASVALSSEGETAVVGGPYDAGEAGAAWVFVNKVPTVTSVTPPGGPEGGKTKVTITGSNFNKAEVESVKFGTTAAVSYTVDSETQISAESPPHAGAGPVDVVVTAAKHESLKSIGDHFTYGSPVVTRTEPNAGPLAGKTTVTLTGANFSESSTVKFGAEAALKVEFKSSTSMTAESPSESPGTVHVRVTNSIGTSDPEQNEEADRYTYTPQPVVTNVAPNLGAETGGETVTITGKYLGPATAVAFGATSAKILAVAEGSITAESPKGTAGPVDVTVTSPGGTSAKVAEDQFTYLPPPVVTKVEPNIGPEGGGPPVTITGTHLLNVTEVKFGTWKCFDCKATSDTEITGHIPGGSGSNLHVTVTTPGGTSATSEADHFTYVAGPAVTKVEPNRGPEAGGTPITITGSNLNEASAVKFGLIAAKSFKVESSTLIKAESPAGSGKVDVTVTTPGGTSSVVSADRFEYVPAPVVEELKPNQGRESGGTSVTITGSNFSEATAVKFGAAAAKSFKVNSPTSIVAESPAGAAGTVDVTVTTLGGTSSTGAGDHFSYLPAPAVTEVKPNQGPETGGTTVTVTGTHLEFATAVKFGAAGALKFKVNSAESITAESPAGTGPVHVTVSTPGGTSTTGEPDKFTYVPVPTVSGVNLNEGPAEKPVPAVTITGTRLNGASAVKFGSANATSYKVESETSITATPPESKAGTVDVTVTTSGGTSATSEADQFKYLAPPEATSGAATAAQTTATLNASVNPQGGKVGVCKFEYGIAVSEHSKPCSSTPGPEAKPVPVAAAVEGLEPSKTYLFRIVIKTPGGEATGASKAFETTAPTAPNVEGLTASSVAQTTATLNASVNAHGAEVEECRFEYGQPPAYASTAECAPKPGKESTPLPVSAAISGLIANTTYHFRVASKNASGKGNVVEQTFKTLPNPPAVVTGEASALTQTTARLTATVNPNGGEVVECKLEYGASAAYGSSAACSPSPGSGTSPVTVSASIGGLSPNTHYHFRISAANAGGTSTGGDGSFTMLQIGGGGAGGPGAGAPGAGGASLPAVTLLGTSLVVRSSGLVTVKLLCPVGESSCVGKITLRAAIAGAKSSGKRGAKRLLTLTHGAFILAGGQRKAFRFRLTAAAQALLSLAGKLRAQATITAHDATGASASTLTRVALRLKH
jgi:hypothetical protein